MSALQPKAWEQHIDHLHSSSFGYLKQWRHSVQAPALAYVCHILGRLAQPALNPVKIKARCYLIICAAIVPPSCSAGAQPVTRGPFLSPCCAARSTLKLCRKETPLVCSLLVLFQSSLSVVSSSQALWCSDLPFSSPGLGREDGLKTGTAWIYFSCFSRKDLLKREMHFCMKLSIANMERGWDELPWIFPEIELPLFSSSLDFTICFHLQKGCEPLESDFMPSDGFAFLSFAFLRFFTRCSGPGTRCWKRVHFKKNASSCSHVIYEHN